MTDVEGLSSDGIRRRLRDLGISRNAIDAAWPGWWVPDAEASPSARAELAFSIARRLGLDPRTIVRPAAAIEFSHVTGAQFKHLSGESDLERAGIVSFGLAVTSAVLAGAPDAQFQLQGLPAGQLRAILLGDRGRTVNLADLVTLSWAAGIPVLHLRVFPWDRKRMAAMVVRIGGRFATLLAKDSPFPAAIAFYLAHELGHIALGQADEDSALVDLDDDLRRTAEGDGEEADADAYALEVLTGEPRPAILPAGNPRSGSELARVASKSAPSLGIDAGVIAEIYGFSTGEWDITTAALNEIYAGEPPVWQRINETARELLDFEAIPADAAEFLDSVLGSPHQ